MNEPVSPRLEEGNKIQFQNYKNVNYTDYKIITNQIDLSDFKPARKEGLIREKSANEVKQVNNLKRVTF